MRPYRALLAASVLVAALVGAAAIEASATPDPALQSTLRLSINQQGADRFQLRISSSRGAEPFFDSGLVAGTSLAVPLPPAAEPMETVTYDLQVFDAAGGLISSRLAKLPSRPRQGATTSSIGLQSLAAMMGGPGPTLVLDSSAEVGGDLSVAGATSVPELRNLVNSPLVGVCGSGTSIRSIGATGTVICETDDLHNSVPIQNIVLGKFFLSGDGDSEGIFVSSSGSVGIGASGVLSAKLRIEDSTQSGFVFTPPIFRVKTSDSDPAVLSMEHPAGIFQLRVTADNEFQIFTTSPVVTVDGGGKVGIANPDPAFLLHLGVDSAAKPGSSTWTIASDARLKDIEGPFERGLEDLAGIQPIGFAYRPGNPLELPTDRSYVGLLAQQVAASIPEAVQTGPQGFLYLQSDPILWTLFNAIRQLERRNQDLASALCARRPFEALCADLP